MNTKQTAIDWYFDKIKSHFEHDGDLLETATFTYAIAKQKEKQQIMQAVFDSMGTNFDPNMGRAEQYYNETFKSE